MTYRQFLNNVMVFLSAPTITDLEFSTVTGFDSVFDQKSYNDSSSILASRETVSDVQDRLIALYKAKGFNASPTIQTGKTNIFIGSPL